MEQTGLQTQQVDFQGTNLLAVQDNDNKVWAGIRWVCDGIGLTRGQRNNETLKIQSDLVLSQGARNLVLPTNGGNQEVLCILIDYLPLWLAKISITPKMQRETPELVEKLIAYQLKAKDVLSAAFLPKEYTASHNNPSNCIILNNTIQSLKSMQQSLIDCTMRQGYQLQNHEEQLDAINDAVTDIEKSLEHDFVYAYRWDEIQNEFYHLNEIINELRNRSGYQAVPKVQDNTCVDLKALIRNMIKPLGESLCDGSLGYNSTYRKVYAAMNVNWQYRQTRFQNQRKLKIKPKKFTLIENDAKLFDIFSNTVNNMLLKESVQGAVLR